MITLGFILLIAICAVVSQSVDHIDQVGKISPEIRSRDESRPNDIPEHPRERMERMRSERQRESIQKSL